MLAHNVLKLPKISFFSRFSAFFRKTGDVIDEGQVFDRATLHALRDLPPHILKDIGVHDR